MPLVCNQLDFGYTARTPVLRGVSATFAPGSLCAILGPNGSGKTTLLRLLLGVLRPRSGTVTLDGTPTASLRGRQRAASLAYLAQRPSVWAEFSVREVVAMGRYALPADAAAIDAALRDAQLRERADDPFALLSAGQQQRAALARVLAQVRGRGSEFAKTTRCILADEPIAAMDPSHALWAMSMLRRLASTGLAVVVVMHDFTLAARFADTALVLDDAGQVAASGPVAEALDPAVLSRVFHTGFQRLQADGHTALLPVSAADTI